MACYHPLKAYRTSQGISFSQLSRDDHLGDIELPCGQCVGCRLRRAQDWSIRIMHESKMHDANCFVTLTYGRDKLPPGGSLCHSDFQKFLKRLRFHTKLRIRFFMCGEYGPLNLRPHYHACLFGFDFPDRVMAGKSGSGEVYDESGLLTRLWGHGITSVQELNRKTAAYCARYIMDKVTGALSEEHYSQVDSDGVIDKRVPEYCHMSLRPGIGESFFRRYGSDIYPADSIAFYGQARTVNPPRYYDKLFKRSGSVKLDAVEFARHQRAIASVPDNSPERREAKERCAIARVSRLRRNLE